MKIFLTGATGFIGGHVLHALCRQGHTVTCLVRRGKRGASGWQETLSRLQARSGVRVVEGEWTQPVQWLATVAGHEAVVNTIGIIRERPGASFEAVHTTSPCALFAEAARTGVSKVVQISALGADEHAQSRFHLSKRAADEFLIRLGVPYVILRPSFVYGRGDHSMAFFARLARLPVIPLPGNGAMRVQPLHVADLVRAILVALERGELDGIRVDLGGSEVLSFEALLTQLAVLQGRRQESLRRLYIPWRFMRVLALLTDLLGGHGPITSEEYGMLLRENFTDLQSFVAHFGFEPRPFRAGIWERLADKTPC